MSDALTLTRQSLFNLRQARQHHVTDNLQTLRRNLIERVFLCVPVGISGQLDDVERLDARAQERLMIIAANSFRNAYKLRSVTELARSLPNGINQPTRTHFSFARDAQILISRHVE